MKKIEEQAERKGFKIAIMPSSMMPEWMAGWTLVIVRKRKESIEIGKRVDPGPGF